VSLCQEEQSVMCFVRGGQTLRGFEVVYLVVWFQQICVSFGHDVFDDLDVVLHFV
jgi:hypothetical protein